ncbi:MAG TPA: BspA family leucine-rich repeat surface protein [Cyclobacteriaceae bacterium]|nr:BspA family leucine-rich repeat surface protein [Cyclobacteriaceae bacterium]
MTKYIYHLILIVWLTSGISVKGLSQEPFVTTWKTDNTGSSTSTQITIPTLGTGYNYTVYWEEVDNESSNNLGNEIVFDDGNQPHTVSFPNAGTYRVKISGNFPLIYFNNGGDRLKILTIEQWGEIQWSSMQSAFTGCSNLTYNATDAPDLSGVTNMSNMFANASSFNGDLSTWNVSNITDMSRMFSAATSFNGNISTWNVSQVTDMNNMFFAAFVFNQDLSSWNVGSVTNMSFMFTSAFQFNQNISTWQVGQVTTMQSMFVNASSFNQNISAWNVSQVTNMASMFSGASVFNQELGAWQVGQVTTMQSMFNNASAFTQNLSSWNVSQVTNMESMFNDASAFNQNLGDWDIGNVTVMTNMFNNSGLSRANYDNTLNGWAALSVLQSNVTLGANGLIYCDGEASRNKLINDYNWNIIGDNKDCPAVIPFITTWEVSGDLSITIPTIGSGYDYTVDWGDENITSGHNGNVTHTYGQAGIYTVSITGDFPRIHFNNEGDKLKIKSIEQWGDTKWTSMANAFWGCENLTYNASDTPNLSEVENITNIFRAASLFNGNIGSWDISKVNNMQSAFFGATSFNQDISAWQVGNVTNMQNVFSLANSFNQNISGWDVSNVNNMGAMFFGASSFNQNLSVWQISNVTTMVNMFNNSGLSRENYDNTLIGWATQNVQANVVLGASGLLYCASADARQLLINNKNWSISGDEFDCRVDQFITFEALTSLTFGTPSFELTASASSELEISYSSSNEAVATISGSLLTITGVGTTIITASQEGNDDYYAAESVMQELIVNKASQTITFESIAAVTFGDPSFELAATASSGLEVSYTSSNEDVASISGNIVTILTAGSTTITANQDGNENYFAAESVQHELLVNKANQTISFETIDTQFLEDGSIALNATATSGLQVSYEILNGPATVSGNIVNFTNPGPVTVRALQQGNENYMPAQPEDRSFVITNVTAQEDVLKSIGFKIFPNPVKDYLNVEFNTTKIVELKLINVYGAEVLSLLPVSPQYTDVSHLNKGLYLLQIITPKGVTSFKVLKE